MNPNDLIDDILFALGPANPANALILSISLRIIAEHVYELRDAGDFREKLLALAEAAHQHSKARSIPTVPLPQDRWPRWEDTCNRCGHVHECLRECGYCVPGAGVCHCEYETAVLERARLRA